MTYRSSTGLRNFTNKFGGYDDALRNGRIEIYSGAQPSSADAAVTGTLLCTITAGGATITAEVAATGTLTLATGAAGSVNTVTVDGINVLGAVVPFNGTLAQTAADVASQINRYTSSPNYIASASGAVVTIAALPGPGATANGFAVAATLTTITSTNTAFAGGVTPANGLLFDNSQAGVLPKLPTQIWSGTNVATGIAGWFRQYGSIADTGGIDATAATLRIDGAIATSGGEMNLNTTSVAAAATTTLASYTLTQSA